MKAFFARQMRVRQVVDAGQQRAEHLAVGDDAADRDAAEIDAVIAALAADQAGARALALGAVVGERDLQRGVDRFRTGIGEEHMVQARRRDVDQPVGELEDDRMAHLEGRRVVELGRLLLDRLGDLRAAVAGIDAPQARGAVEDLAAVAASCSACPWRDTSMRGACLNCRFAVNGIQNALRSFGVTFSRLDMTKLSFK